MTKSAPAEKNSARFEQQNLIEAITADPLNENLHLQYARYGFRTGKLHLAYAEMKMAISLGAESTTSENELNSIGQSLPEPENMNHNRYFRFISLASEIVSRAGTSDVSVLDVGGGDGALASFIPEASYCLAEPVVNGISGTDLPFPDRSFDFVVSCHVLEHIPIDERAAFLDQLVSKAKRGVILLNPCQVDGTFVEERIQLVLDITKAPWAREHLDCTLPRVEDIKNYARDKGLEICVKPNGTMTTSMAFVFIDYFASKTDLHSERRMLNRFFNEKFTDILDSEAYPTSYLFYLGRPQAEKGVAQSDV